jgi:hypothetical protein
MHGSVGGLSVQCDQKFGRDTRAKKWFVATLAGFEPTRPKPLDD